MSNVERLYEPEDLENEVLNWLGGEDPSTGEYTTAVGNLERLHKLAKDSDLKAKLMPSSETIANGSSKNYEPDTHGNLVVTKHNDVYADFAAEPSDLKDGDTIILKVTKPTE